MEQYQFKYSGKTLDYFVHKFNDTRHNERAIEIPIVLSHMKDEFDKGKTEFLEVGNTLRCYFSFNFDWAVVDKYDKNCWVTREDVVDCQQGKKFDLIMSISTMEHVGRGDIDLYGEELDETKISKSLVHLKSLLKDDGLMVITVPLGYSDEIDQIIKEGKIFDKVNCMQRGKYNEWVETDVTNVLKGDKSQYGPELVVVGSTKEYGNFTKLFITHLAVCYIYGGSRNA